MRGADGAKSGTGDSQSRYTSDKQDIQSSLKHFRNERTRVQLRFPSQEAALTGSILDVDAKHLLLEDVKPRDSAALMTSGERFALTARTDGVYLYAEDLRCLLTESERGIPFYVVSLPKKVLFQQRRQAARVVLPLRIKTAGARATLQFGKSVLDAQIIDVSAGGCRVALTEDHTAQLKEGLTLGRCVLRIRDQLEVESKAIIRHAMFDVRSEQTFCGIELWEMNVTDRRRLERFVEAQQAQHKMGLDGS